MAGPYGAPPAGAGSICHLCRRKLPSPEALARHERLSELHMQNLEKQDELVQQHKQDVLAGVAVLRQQLHDAGAAEEGAADAGRRAALEAQLRQLLGEFGMAQEMLEHSLARRSPKEPRARAPAAAEPRTWRETRVGRLTFDLGAACWQGGKEMQEDRFLLDINLEAPDGQPVTGFCVLDGHSGSRCVDFVIEHLPLNLQARLSDKPSLSEQNLSQAVSEACLQTDQEFLAQARQHELMDGSTMLLGLVFQEPSPKAPRPHGSCRLLVANIGDSRAVLCRGPAEAAAAATAPDGSGVQLQALRVSSDHKPDRADEQRRIQARGGVVDFHGVWRVFAPQPVVFGGRSIPRWGLAVSRAFGDLLLKEPERYGCNAVAPGGLVTAAPELHSVEVEPATDRFLVIACDGVWDVLRDEDAVAVCAGQAGAELAAHALVRHAFAAGSGDNLTALVVAWRAAAAE